MKVETDLKRIKQTARKKEDENWEFRSFLKGYDIEVEELDSIVHRLFDGVYREIDCTACGNCCKEISPVLEQEDIERISRGLGISPENCRSFPHLHKEEFVFRLIGVIENYEVCPIVFNVYEQLKAELWHV